MTETVGQEISKDRSIEDAVQHLVTKVMEKNRHINEVKPAKVELKDYFSALCEKINASRGRPLFYPYVGSGAGNEVYVELEDGSVKIDFINGIGINILGHSHPKLIAAGIRGSLQDVVMQGNLEPNKEYLTITEKLVELAKVGTNLKYAWLSTCGTMANENALKMARQKNTPAKHVVALKNAFAGRSTLMAELTDNPAYKEGLPSYDDVLRVDYFDAKNPASIDHSLRQLKEHVAKFPKDISCFCFEPMQGEGGYKVAPREFFLPLLDFCKEQGIAVWADEVQTFCRTGELLAIQTMCLGDKVDIVTVAKALQGGATLYTEEYNPKPGLIAGTFSGASAALSAGIAVLEELSTGGYFGKSGKIQATHDFFVDGLNMLATTTCEGLIHEPGGMGLMVAFTPHDGSSAKRNELLTACYNNGLISFGCGRDPFRMRFLIPANTQRHHLEEALKIIEKSLLETK